MPDTDIPLPAHLTQTVSDRGLGYLPDIQSEYGGEVNVSTSSAASGPHVWLRVSVPAEFIRPDGSQVKAPIHLNAENALHLADQLVHIVADHYQLDYVAEELAAHAAAVRAAVVGMLSLIATEEDADDDEY